MVVDLLSAGEFSLVIFSASYFVGSRNFFIGSQMDHWITPGFQRKFVLDAAPNVLSVFLWLLRVTEG